MKRFPVERFLQSVRNVSFNLFSNMKWAHTNLAVKRTGGTHKLEAGLLAAHDFNQRQ